MNAQVAVVMGSLTDYPVMKDAEAILQEFGISFETKILSAHRTPREMLTYGENARERGISVIIAGAGGAAHLPGMIASVTDLPVIGVPIPVGSLHGEDALLSIVQMPKGVPVATVAIGNATNAGILAIQILSTNPTQKNLREKLRCYKVELQEKVQSMNATLSSTTR